PPPSATTGHETGHKMTGLALPSRPGLVPPSVVASTSGNHVFRSIFDRTLASGFSLLRPPIRSCEV
ncbi:hypothetical protein GBA52_008214, partial [Prunus armeniaca]